MHGTTERHRPAASPLVSIEDKTLDVLAVEIKRFAAAAVRDHGNYILNGIETGRRLIAAKELLRKERGHGHFQAWCKEHCGISDGYCRLWMRIARKMPECIAETENGNVTDLDIRSLAALVAKDRPEDYDEETPYHLRPKQWQGQKRGAPGTSQLAVAKQMVNELLARLTAEYVAKYPEKHDDEPRFVPALHYGDKAYARAMDTVIHCLESQDLHSRIADIKSMLKEVGLSAENIMPIKKGKA